ncbi:hypothetical protein N7456_005899 [Penicillium angulare]|uniref:Uncharacterized protein n=1 Tax=Penicillium angulare TaxID=116970 RepID=A0A9W9FZ91_9EURO|nr:hypothetical protein N7456_005899 [Penicillium angulare]
MPTPSPSMGTAPMRVSTNHLAQVQDVANKYQSARHECMKEEGTAEDSVARYEDTEDIGSDLGCFAGCVGYKMGAIHEGGGFNEKNWADHVSQIDDAEERRRLWYEGSIMSHSVNGMNRCDTGNKLARLSKEFSKPPKEQHLPSVQ